MYTYLPQRARPSADSPSSCPPRPLLEVGRALGGLAPSSAQAEGLQGNYLLLSPSAKPAILSAQTLQSSGQEAKVNFEKVFKRPKHKHQGGCLQGVGMKMGKGERMGSFNRLKG